MIRRLVIADIHGCIKSFKAIVERQIRLTKLDELYLLGDYIDKGPDSKGVLDYLIQLIESGFQIFPIRGNHEQMLLDLKKVPARLLPAYLKIQKGLDLLVKGGIPEKYMNFAEKLPYYIELDKYFLVHAGFDFRSASPFTDYESMMNIRKFEPDLDILQGKQIIRGHQPIILPTIMESIEKCAPVITLDNGITFGAKATQFERLGNLLAFNLDSKDVFVQPCLDFS